MGGLAVTNYFIVLPGELALHFRYNQSGKITHYGVAMQPE